MRTLRIGILAVAVVGLPASAHAYLAEADPPIGSVVSEPPARLRLAFTETIEPKLSTFVLYDAEGTQLAELSASVDEEGHRVTLSLPGRLEPGTYTLVWRVLSSVDGHVTQGIYPFGVGAGTPAPPPPEAGTGGAPSPSPVRIGVRGLAFLGALALVGGLFLSLLGADLPERARLAPSLVRALWASWGLALGASLADLALQARALGPPEVWGPFLFQTRYGWIGLGRLALLLGLGPLLAPSQGGPRKGAAALGALMLLGFSLSGHSASLAEGAPLAVLADWLHLLAASLWVGGVFQLAFLLPILQRGKGEERLRWPSAVRDRFYPWALISASTLLLTGFHLTYRHLPDLGRLGTTAYGRAYLAKHLLLLPLVALAALRLLRVLRAARWVRLEALAAVAIVFLAGALTLLPPGTPWREEPGTGSHEPGQPLLFLHPAGEFVIGLSVRSPQVGENVLDVYVTDARGNPVEDALRVWLVFAYRERELGEVTAVAQPQGGGRYRVEGSYLSLAGKWRITVFVRLRGRAEDLQAEFPLTVEGE